MKDSLITIRNLAIICVGLLIMLCGLGALYSPPPPPPTVPALSIEVERLTITNTGSILVTNHGDYISVKPSQSDRLTALHTRLDALDEYGAKLTRPDQVRLPAYYYNLPPKRQEELWTAFFKQQAEVLAPYAAYMEHRAEIVKSIEQLK